MGNFLAAMAVFVGLHVLIAGTGLRAPILRILGERAYHAIFSLVSVVSLGWAAYAFGAVRYGPADQLLWEPSETSRALCQLLTLAAFLLAIPGILTPGPTAFEPGPIDAGAARGILRITRRPLLWGFVLWGTGHLIANGDLSAVLLFGPLTAMVVYGLPSIDRKTAQRPGWREYAARTSNIPFAAILSGRNGIVLRELWWKLLLAMAAYVGTIQLHPGVIGVSAWP